MANFKFYDFKCEACKKEFRAGMWKNRDGEPEGVSCECGEQLLPFEKETGPSIMIGTHGGVKGHDWHKGLSSDYKDFLKRFSKRHGKGNTVNTF